MIYLMATAGALLSELIRYSTKQNEYPTLEVWIKDRWDNIAIAFIGAVLLASVWGETSVQVSEWVNFDLTNAPKTAGLLIGLGSTPIINFLKKKIENKTKQEA